MKGTFLAIAVLIMLTSCSMNNKKPSVIGHRGAMGHETENTLPSIQKALDFEVDMIEIDVFKIQDDEIVVFHDEGLERLTDGIGQIESYNIGDLEQVKVEGGHRIPLLQEVLDLMNNKVELNIELKGANTAELVNSIMDYNVREKGWDFDKFIVSSFKWEELRKMRKVNPEVRIAILTEEDPLDALEIAKELNAEAINPYFVNLTTENVSQIQKEGFKIYTWTVNDLEDIEKMKVFGVDGIITNYPERVN